MAVSFKSKFGPTNNETERGLRDTFRNTPLEPYVTGLIPFFFSEQRREYDRQLKGEVQSDFAQYLNSLINLATMLREIKDNQIFGCGWTIGDLSDSKSIYASVEEIFLKRLDELEDYFDFYEWAEELGEALGELREVLADFPCRNGFDFDDRELDSDGNVVEGGYRHLSKEELDNVLHALKRYEPAVQRFFVAEQDSVRMRFIKYALDKGVPKSNKMYRELYKYLDCFNCIPAEVKNSHLNIVSTPYPESNYIKSYVKRIEKKAKLTPSQSSE